MRIEWDPARAANNLRKHGVSFEIAMLVFADPDALFEQERNVAGELRWKILGVADGFVLLMVAQSIEEQRDKVEAIRILSSRRANRKERRRYEKEIGSI